MNTQNLGIVSPVAMGDWQENFQYQKLNIVRHNGSSYIAKSENSGIEPGVESGWSAYWMLLNTDVEGAQGPQGPAGEGVPTGGLAGQVLSKNSDTNYDTKWIPQSQIAAGSAVNDGSGRNIVDTYETKADANTKNANLQDQITNNSQNIEKNSQIGARNSKRLDGLEQRINPSPFVTDDSVAYKKDVPQNAVGAVEVQKIGGMTYKDGNTLKSAKVTEVKSVGANLWDEQWEVGQILIDSGNPISGDTRIRSKNFIPLNGETEYNFSYDNNSNVFFCYDKNYAFIGVKYQCDKKFTTFPNTRYVKFMLTPDYGKTYKNDIMLNKGSTAQPYTPYVEHTLPIPEAVQVLDGYGEGVDATYNNYIAWSENGTKKTWNKKVGKTVFDGTEVWELYSNDLWTNALDTKAMNSSPVVCSGAYKIEIFADNVKTKVFTNGALTVAEWKAYLAEQYAAGTPVTVVYALATPEVTDISDLITSDNLLSIQGGGTLTFENEYGYAVPSTVEYITAEATA